MATIEALTAMLKKEPNDPFLLYALGQAHAGRGEHDRAVAWYDRCLASDAGYLYAYYHKAVSLRAAGREDEAIASVRAGLAQPAARSDRHAAAELASLLDELA